MNVALWEFVSTVATGAYLIVGVAIGVGVVICAYSALQFVRHGW